MSTTQKRWTKPAQPLLNPPNLFSKEARAEKPRADINWTNHDPDLAETCQKCGAVVGHYDAIGGAWCDGCKNRALLINVGFYQDFPRLAQNGKVIPSGKQGWQGFAMGAPLAVIALLTGDIGQQSEVVTSQRASTPKTDTAIYVDAIIHWGNKPAPGAERYFGNGKPSCHMSTSDHSPAGLERLHQFAERIGMKRNWFQNSDVMPHYDLTPSKRALAVKAGAVSVEGTEIVRLCGRAHIRQMLSEGTAA